MRVLAIDDEPLALRQLVAYIEKVPYLELVGQCQSAIEASGVLQREAVDALFCDINMPDLNGMDFVRSLSRAEKEGRVPFVVFTTAYSEYAVEGFAVEAVDYLLKPFSFKDFIRACERLRSRMELVERAAAGSEGHDEEEAQTLFVKTGRSTQAIKLSDILYIQGMSEYVRFYLTNQPRPLVSLMAMKRLEEQLPVDRFMRVHRSFIVSLAHVRQLSRGRLFLSDGTEIPIGELYKDPFNTWVSKHLMNN